MYLMGMVDVPPVSHRDIIELGAGPAAVARDISEHEVRQGRACVDANTVKAWKRTDSIPAPYFEAFAAVGLATLEELAAAAAVRRTRVAA